MAYVHYHLLISRPETGDNVKARLICLKLLFRCRFELFCSNNIILTLHPLHQVPAVHGGSQLRHDESHARPPGQLHSCLRGSLSWNWSGILFQSLDESIIKAHSNNTQHFFGSFLIFWSSTTSSKLFHWWQACTTYVGSPLKFVIWPESPKFSAFVPFVWWKHRFNVKNLSISDLKHF